MLKDQSEPCDWSLVLNIPFLFFLLCSCSHFSLLPDAYFLSDCHILLGSILLALKMFPLNHFTWPRWLFNISSFWLNLWSSNQCKFRACFSSKSLLFSLISCWESNLTSFGYPSYIIYNGCCTNIYLCLPHHHLSSFQESTAVLNKSLFTVGVFFGWILFGIVVCLFQVGFVVVGFFLATSMNLWHPHLLSQDKSVGRRTPSLTLCCKTAQYLCDPSWLPSWGAWASLISDCSHCPPCSRATINICEFWGSSLVLFLSFLCQVGGHSTSALQKLYAKHAQCRCSGFSTCHCKC